MNNFKKDNDLKDRPKDNILSSFNSYTYNIELYAVSREEYSLYTKEITKDIGSSEGYIFKTRYMVVATAKSVITVRSLEMKNIPLANEGGTFTSFNLELYQTRGMSLFQALSIAAKMGNWDNINEQVYILDVSFNGIDEHGTQHSNIEKKRYPISLGMIKSHFDHVGTTYTLPCYPRGVIASTSIESKIEQHITLSGVRNTTDFFKSYSRQINDALDIQYEGMGDIHVFEPDIMFSNKPFKRSGDETNSQRDGTMSERNSVGTVTLQISSGTSITSAISSVFGLCRDITDLLNNENGTRISHITTPSVEYLGYNDKLGRYRKKYTWKIIPKYVVIPFDNRLSNAEIEKRIVNGLHNKSISKIYNYTYTGLNTEVVSMDLNTSTFDSQTRVSAMAALNAVGRALPITTDSRTSYDVQEGLKQLDSDSIIRVKSVLNTPTITHDEQSGIKTETYYLEDINNSDFVKNVDLFKTRIKLVNKTDETANGVDPTDAEVAKYEANLKTLRFGANAFFSAELKIKGDPYWLFSAVPSKEFSNSASYTRYNTAALVFNYPTDNYNEINKADTAITGIYLVTEVISTFTGGVFEQKLSLKRILNGTSVNRLVNSGEDI